MFKTMSRAFAQSALNSLSMLMHACRTVGMATRKGAARNALCIATLPNNDKKFVKL